MPIQLPPLSRRRFMRNSLAAGAGLLLPRDLHGLEQRGAPDPNRIALLSDTHIAADSALVAWETNMAANLRRVSEEVLAVGPRPAHVIINGDFAFKDGRAADYATAVRLLEPLRRADMAIHVGLGNHDHRERFWEGLPDERIGDTPVTEKHVELLETPSANWLILDSLHITDQPRGALGEFQLKWIADKLDAHPKKPAVVIVHHYPEGKEFPKPTGITETTALFETLSPRKQAKALIYGHSHRWRHQRRVDGLHLVNLPATAYVFEKTEPNGWVDARSKDGGATLELRCIDPKHAAHRQKLNLEWRS